MYAPYLLDVVLSAHAQSLHLLRCEYFHAQETVRVDHRLLSCYILNRIEDGVPMLSDINNTFGVSGEC